MKSFKELKFIEAKKNVGVSFLTLLLSLEKVELLREFLKSDLDPEVLYTVLKNRSFKLTEDEACVLLDRYGVRYFILLDKELQKSFQVLYKYLSIIKRADGVDIIECYLNKQIILQLIMKNMIKCDFSEKVSSRLLELLSKY